jgi:hypothetical protein
MKSVALVLAGLAKESCHAYDNLVEDSTKVQNRLKEIYRGRGISSSGHDLYRADQRSDWLAKLGEDAARFRAESLLDQLESLSQLGKQAKQRLLAQEGTALAALRHEAIKAYYQRLIDHGTRPELARVSVARKLDSITLTIWQRREEFNVKKAFAQEKTWLPG